MSILTRWLSTSSYDLQLTTYDFVGNGCDNIYINSNHFYNIYINNNQFV